MSGGQEYIPELVMSRGTSLRNFPFESQQMKDISPEGLEFRSRVKMEMFEFYK